jgi:hypothetical protein
MTHTAATVKTQLAAILQTSEASLPTTWDTRVATALARAVNEIEAILIGERGYTAAQVAAWDMLDDVTLKHTLFCIFQFDQGSQFEWPQIQSWDQSKFLRDIAVLDTDEESVAVEDAPVTGGALDDGVYPTDIEDDYYAWDD